MSRQQHLVYGDPNRFQVVADFVLTEFGKQTRYIADVAGGKGILTRILNKKNLDCELIDPRQTSIKGIKHRQEPFLPEMTDYYDLLIGLHPDGALRELGEAALIRPVVMIPCCNFWDQYRRGQKELLMAIKNFYRDNYVQYQEIVLDFKGPKNIAIVSTPPSSI